MVGFHNLGALLQIACAVQLVLHVGTDALHHFLHAQAELPALARRKQNEHWLVRVLEIVHVHLVRGCRKLLGNRGQVVAHNVAAADVGRACKVDVEAVCADVQGEIQGLHGPVLVGDTAWSLAQLELCAVVHRDESRIVGRVQAR